ncbi:MAG: right-handed parallel beta-helix repeat-containing protein [Planctomycetales bacterium]
MNRVSFAAVAGALGLVVMACSWPAASQTESLPGPLPGARPEIDAARYPSLQAAIDALPDQGGVVRLPPGTFDIEAPLVIQQAADVQLIGAATATHIRNTNAEGKPALVIRPKPRPDGRAGQPQWRVHLSNFRITGNPQSGHGIEAVRVNEIHIEGVIVSRHGKDGIRLDGCYEDPRVCDSLITYNKGTGLNLVACHDIVVSGNQFEENQDALRCIDSFNLCMTGNCLDDHLGHGVVIENTYGSVLSGNMIEECQGTAVVLDRNCYGDTVSANVIAHNGMGVDLRDAHGCAVSANTFTLMHAHAVRVGKDSGRIAITGNNFSNSFVGEERTVRGAGDRDAGGLLLESTSHVAVSGNVFAGLSTKALDLAGRSSRKVLFANNVLVDAASDHDDERLEGSLVRGNVIDGKAAQP